MASASDSKSQSPRWSVSTSEALHKITDNPVESVKPDRKLIRKEVNITNTMGLHARPAMQFVDLANKFASKITVCKGTQCVNGKSIMEMMLLAAGPGTSLTLIADGPDASSAVNALAALVDRKFDEE